MIASSLFNHPSTNPFLSMFFFIFTFLFRVAFCEKLCQVSKLFWNVTLIHYVLLRVALCGMILIVTKVLCKSPLLTYNLGNISICRMYSTILTRFHEELLFKISKSFYGTNLKHLKNGIRKVEIPNKKLVKWNIIFATSILCSHLEVYCTETHYYSSKSDFIYLTVNAGWRWNRNNEFGGLGTEVRYWFFKK